jgi:hypothetical protein
MAGVAHRIVLAAPTGADGNHESVGFDDVATRRLDADRPRYEHRPIRYHLHSRPGGHGLSARMTIISSVRQPGSI